VAPWLSGGWQHNYSNKTRQAGCDKEQSIILLCLCTASKHKTNILLYCLLQKFKGCSFSLFIDIYLEKYARNIEKH